LREINDMVQYMRGFLRLIAKSGVNPCKHQLSQKVNMAPYYLVTTTVEKLFGAV
jgi:hypothetical protein